MKKFWWWVAGGSIALAIYMVTSSPYATDAYTEKLITVTGMFSANQIHILEMILRKTAHMTEFGILALIMKIALPQRSWAYPVAFLVTALFGVADEIHQYSIPSRTASFIDVMWDALGAGLALSAWYGWNMRKKE